MSTEPPPPNNRKSVSMTRKKKEDVDVTTMDTTPAIRHTVIIRLNDDEHKGLLPEMLKTLKSHEDPSSQEQERRATRSTCLSQLRDLAYDAANKQTMLKEEYGMLDILTDVMLADVEEPRCKALGLLLTLVLSKDVNILVGKHDRLLTCLINILLFLRFQNNLIDDC